MALLPEFRDDGGEPVVFAVGVGRPLRIRPLRG